MRQSHVEKRSRKYAARQYVSETHDHKPDAPRKAPANVPGGVMCMEPGTYPGKMVDADGKLPLSGFPE